MLSQLTEPLGVFLGRLSDASSDSLDWVEPLYELTTAVLAGDVADGSARETSWCGRLRETAAGILARAGRRADDPWGWKLPETMLVLAPVLRAFPEARVVHLVRHPVTSALRRTHVTSRLDNAVGRAVLQAAYRAHGMDVDRIERDEPYLHNAVSWDFQLRGVIDVLRRAGRPPLTLRYEDVCADPSEAQGRIGAFLGLDPTFSAKPDLTDWARAGRLSALDSRAREVWAICGQTAEDVGYRLADAMGASSPA